LTTDEVPQTVEDPATGAGDLWQKSAHACQCSLVTSQACSAIKMFVNYSFADFWRQDDLSDVTVVIAAPDGTELPSPAIASAHTGQQAPGSCRTSMPFHVVVVSRDTNLGGARRRVGRTRLRAPGPMHMPVWQTAGLPHQQTNFHMDEALRHQTTVTPDSVRELSVPLPAACFMREALEAGLCRAWHEEGVELPAVLRTR
jgi:hypothetical protein